ncbi:DUF4097 family beta strand repeat-containing protein [Mycobacterium botniense]|uniref:Adhesin domain-containing protein n=1 Tax=Mycobacterium botniense TaxID=84962 RepID=A0A7I9Y340_9MYCO|nr:DUF4097 family beta strand repeat-containing protein [Mycobacterium botniense]GFG76470.1 hypothetical protein MBOT_38350 [Mycobacterium botniense]
MPIFATPQPITATIQAGGGSVRLVATDRADTVVEICPRDASRRTDVRSAEQAWVSYASGRLAVAPAKCGFLGRRTGAVDIHIALPTRSRVQAAVASADLHAEGRFADIRFASTSGNLVVQSVSGRLQAATASGGVDVGVLDGELTFQAASGSLVLSRLCGTVRSEISSGSVAIACAVSGAVLVRTGSGEVEIGVPEGTAAQLDIMTGTGVVTNRVPRSAGSEHNDHTLAVRVRTGSGSVTIGRAA